MFTNDFFHFSVRHRTILKWSWHKQWNSRLPPPASLNRQNVILTKRCILNSFLFCLLFQLYPNWICYVPNHNIISVCTSERWKQMRKALDNKMNPKNTGNAAFLFHTIKQTISQTHKPNLNMKIRTDLSSGISTLKCYAARTPEYSNWVLQSRQIRSEHVRSQDTQYLKIY